MSDNDAEDIDELLQQLNQREEENQQKCYRLSAVRIAQEIRRRAKAEQRLLPYMHACFRVMVNSAGLFDAAAGRDASIELIRLLESPEQARRIQPDLADLDYENAIHWMSSCAYDNLADNTAELFGFNSDGMHQCINDGIQVCRRTGKMQCVACFREYASHVYCAADDLDMAMHFAKQSLENPNPASESRRWASSHTISRLLLRRGDLADALQSLQRDWELIKVYHTPHEARHKTFFLTSEVLALLGQEPDNSLSPGELPPVEEYPLLHLYHDYVIAVRDCISGDYQSAIDRLTDWDAQLKSKQQLSNWFHTRLRVLCALRMAGDTTRLRTLSEELEPVAQRARDWYTLRCMSQIKDLSRPAYPVPTLNPVNVGPTGTTSYQSTSHQAATSDSTAPSTTEQASTTADSSAAVRVPDLPLDLQELAMTVMTMAQQQQFGQPIDPAVVDQAREGLLACSSDDSQPPERTHWLLHLMTFVPVTPDQADNVWQWAQRLAAILPNDAVALNLLATIGHRLASIPDLGFGSAPVSPEQIADMIRRSLDLDPSRSSNFERAGEFFAQAGDESEAERCFARSFRLDRTRTSAALGLADIYARTDRPGDALEVLDMSLREGQGDARAAWQAAVLSSYLQKYEAVLTYLNRFAQDVPDHAWMQFYRAQALLALDRPDEALEAIEKFNEGEPDRKFVTQLMRATAHGLRKDQAATFASLKQFLVEPLASVDYLATPAIAKLFDLLWNACQWLDSGEPLRQQLIRLMVTSGMTPERYLEAVRMARPKEEGISFYVITLSQTLPPNWAHSTSCGAGQQDWQQYLIRYGVLSTSQAKAERLAIEFQAQSGLVQAELLDAQAFDQEYVDSPGLVWQSVPEGMLKE